MSLYQQRSDQGKRAFGAVIVTNPSSFVDINVSSTFKTRNTVVTGTASVATITATTANLSKIVATGFVGTTTVLSGTTTITVSNANVTSGKPIFLSHETNTASNRPIVFSVDSVSNGISFSVVGHASTVAPATIRYVIFG